MGFTERRRQRERLAALGLEEPDLPAADRGERPIEPRVAEEWRLLELLCRDERRTGGTGAGGDGLKRAPLGSRQPIARCRQLFEQPLQGSGQETQFLRSPARPLRELRGLGRSEGVPGGRGGS